MINRAERIAEELKEKARRYQQLSDLLESAHYAESHWDDLSSEFGDKCGWVSEQLSDMVGEIESEMAQIAEALE